MARLEVVVHEVDTTAQEAAASPQSGGLLLADILAQTGGSYEWEFPVDEQLRRRWVRAATEIGDAQLRARVGAPTVRVSLEQFRGRDPQATRIAIDFTLHYAHDEGLRAARAAASRPAL